MWKYVPKEEHWLTFDIEMLTVEAWTPELQFEFMDLNNDTSLTPGELTKHLDRLRLPNLLPSTLFWLQAGRRRVAGGTLASTGPTTTSTTSSLPTTLSSTLTLTGTAL